MTIFERTKRFSKLAKLALKKKKTGLGFIVHEIRGGGSKRISLPGKGTD